jgi:hypothetical protein
MASGIIAPLRITSANEKRGGKRTAAVAVAVTITAAAAITSATTAGAVRRPNGGLGIRIIDTRGEAQGHHSSHCGDGPITKSFLHGPKTTQVCFLFDGFFMKFFPLWNAAGLTQAAVLRFSDGANL